MTPVTAGVPDRQKDRLVLFFGPLQSLWPPGIPVHGIVSMQQQIGTALSSQPIRVLISCRWGLSGLIRTKAGRTCQDRDKQNQRGKSQFPHDRWLRSYRRNLRPIAAYRVKIFRAIRVRTKSALRWKEKDHRQGGGCDLRPIAIAIQSLGGQMGQVLRRSPLADSKPRKTETTKRRSPRELQPFFPWR